MFCKWDRLLLMLRFTTFALWLIFTALIIPGFQPGGRYLILLFAFLTALGGGLIRRLTRRMDYRARGLVGGLGVFPAWLIIQPFSSGAHFNTAGLFLDYLGLAVIEMLLPNFTKVFPMKRS